MNDLTVGEAIALLQQYPEHHHLAVHVEGHETPMLLRSMKAHTDHAGPMVVLS